MNPRLLRARALILLAALLVSLLVLLTRHARAQGAPAGAWLAGAPCARAWRASSTRTITSAAASRISARTRNSLELMD